MKSALHGLRVIEMGQLLAGPFSGLCDVIALHPCC